MRLLETPQGDERLGLLEVQGRTVWRLLGWRQGRDVGQGLVYGAEGFGKRAIRCGPGGHGVEGTQRQGRFPRVRLVIEQEMVVAWADCISRRCQDPYGRAMQRLPGGGGEAVVDHLPAQRMGE